MLTKEEFRELWIEALEGDKWEQTTGLLSDGKAFCCLGVACELAHTREDIDIELRREMPGFEDDYGMSESKGFYYGDGKNGSSFILPEVVWDALGLINGEGDLARSMEDGGPTTLVQANDDGMSFKEIAEMLRDGCFWKENAGRGSYWCE